MSEEPYNKGDIVGQHKVPTTMCLKSRAFTMRAILQQVRNPIISEEPYNKGDIVGQHKVPTTMCLKHIQSYNKRGILYVISLYYVTVISPYSDITISECDSVLLFYGDVLVILHCSTILAAWMIPLPRCPSLKRPLYPNPPK